MSSTCTIVIPLSDLDIAGDYRVASGSTAHTNIHNIDINIDNSKVQQCDISLMKDHQNMPLDADQIQYQDNRGRSQTTAGGSRWRTNASTTATPSHISNGRNPAEKWMTQSTELIIPNVCSVDHAQSGVESGGVQNGVMQNGVLQNGAVWNQGGGHSRWLTQSIVGARSHSVDGSTDPRMNRVSRERQRIADRMRSLSLERTQDCWGRKRSVSVEDEVITHGEAPIHNAAKSVIKQVGEYTRSADKLGILSISGLCLIVLLYEGH